MNRPRRRRHTGHASEHLVLALTVGLCAVCVAPPVRAQTPPSSIDLATAATVRNTAARALVPLLQNVRKRVRGETTVGRGQVPDSPFTGTQTTLLAFSVGKRPVPVDPHVTKAMDRLLAWKIGETGTDEEAALFDRWLAELTNKAVALGGGAGVFLCDPACVVQRMRRLDEAWGASPATRAESRDEALLNALIAAVSPEK